MSFLRSCDSDCFTRSHHRDVTRARISHQLEAPNRSATSGGRRSSSLLICHSCRVLPTFAFSTLRHANHLLSADYINYGKISIQIKDKFRLEMRLSTNEGKTTEFSVYAKSPMHSPTGGLVMGSRHLVRKSSTEEMRVYRFRSRSFASRDTLGERGAAASLDQRCGKFPDLRVSALSLRRVPVI